MAVLPKEKTVLVTGASSGIGRATVLELDRRGFQVFAGVRTIKPSRAPRRFRSLAGPTARYCR